MSIRNCSRNSKSFRGIYFFLFTCVHWLFSHCHKFLDVRFPKGRASPQNAALVLIFYLFCSWGCLYERFTGNNLCYALILLNSYCKVSNNLGVFNYTRLKIFEKKISQNYFSKPSIYRRTFRLTLNAGMDWRGGGWECVCPLLVIRPPAESEDPPYVLFWDIHFWWRTLKCF